MSGPRWSVLALLAACACGGPPQPKASFEYALPEFDARLDRANFEYVLLGATARVSIPARRDAMKRTLEIGLVDEALRQLRAQAPPGEPTALVNVVIVVTNKTVTKDALFTSTSSVQSDQELVVRADIVRFRAPAPAPAPAPPVATPSSPPSED
jgi:hypothetical protein